MQRTTDASMRALSNLFELMRQRITRQAVSTQQKLTSLISRGKGAMKNHKACPITYYVF
jgi:hypothetical protein